MPVEELIDSTPIINIDSNTIHNGSNVPSFYNEYNMASVKPQSEIAKCVLIC